MSKTTTIVIDHSKCDPQGWTGYDLAVLAKFVHYGGVKAAAYLLTRMGLRVVASEHHQPLGGTFELIGYMSHPITPGDDIELEAGPRELCDVTGIDPGGVTEVVKVYQGPVQYAVGVPIGDADGAIEDWEFELKDTEAEARAYHKALRS